MTRQTSQPAAQTPQERLYEQADIIRRSYLRDRYGRPHTRQDWSDYLDALLAFLKERAPPEGASP